MEKEHVEGGVKKKNQENEEAEREVDETFDESTFSELERSQTGRKTSIFKYYSFKEKGELWFCIEEKLSCFIPSLHGTY